MKPVVIFRHACCDGAGYLGEFLTAHKTPWQEVRLDLDQPIPASVDDFSGVVLMGGPMSVNDELPWITPILQFISIAIERDIPVLGHCLGGQLMSKAFGCDVTKNSVKEIGWGEVRLSRHPDAIKWFGNQTSFLSFHWHSETFQLPPGANHLLSSQHCDNQAYSIGKHLALQCHIEVDQNMIETWCNNWRSEIDVSDTSESVQSEAKIYAEIETKLKDLNAQANYTYSQWIKGLIH